MSSKCLINVTNENERLIQYNEISLTVHSKARRTNTLF
jgi:hypothetical protein